MNIHTDKTKTQENKTQSAANDDANGESILVPTFQFADNRLEAINQREIGGIVNNKAVEKSAKFGEDNNSITKDSKVLSRVAQLVKDLKVNDDVIISGNPPFGGKTGVITEVLENSYKVKVKVFGEREFNESLVRLANSDAPIVERDQEYPDPYILEYEKLYGNVKDIMARIVAQTISIGISCRQDLEENSEEEFALLCTYLMEMLNDKARKQMDGLAVTLRVDMDRRKMIVNEVIKLVRGLKAAKNPGEVRNRLGDFFGWSIANQNFLESNNRGTYIMLVLMGAIFKAPIPAADVVLSREKIGFDSEKIKAQYMDM